MRAIPGHLKGRPGPEDGRSGVIIDNRTGLPDADVRAAIASQWEAIQPAWVENATLQMGEPTTFQLYANHGANMLTRSPFSTPSNVIEEIELARQVADTDDDIAATIGQVIADAFGSGMQNLHEDEQTVGLFNKICGPVINGGVNMDNLLKEMYREYMISASVTTISLYTRKRFSFTPRGTERKIQKQIAAPVVGILPAENIRVVTNDIFGLGELAYEAKGKLKEWLETYFNPGTSPAVKAKMRREQPVLSTLFTGRIVGDWDDPDPFIQGKTLFTLNQRMVHRTTMPKGASAYPRPLLTANFALLEAKRLLNIMDYSLLQGGTNYIVVAKIGSEKFPALQPEVDNLESVVRAASRTGVLVGDHRIAVDIITPDLTELLNPAKRKLIGRKMAMMLLRVPEQVTGDSGGEGSRQELEFISRTVTSDRLDIKRHVEGYIYEETVRRNPTVFSKGSPNLWFPKIVLAGTKDFQTLITQARDRGDIPRKYAVEALGFDYEAGVAQRKAEKARGDDEVMTPGAVPFAGNPADQGGGEGRPPGSSSNNGGGSDGPSPDPAQRQRRRLAQRRRGGEPVRADWNPETRSVIRYGELTAALLDEFPDHTVGRVTQFEREAVVAEDVQQTGNLAVVPVNPSYEVTELRAFRLSEGLSVIVGQRRDDDALVARALCFREPQFDIRQATELAMRWGFIDGTVEEGPEVVSGVVVAEAQRSPVQEVVAAVQENPELVGIFAKAFAEAIGGLVPNITLNLPGEGAMEFIRDEETGAIIGKRPVQS